MKGIPDLGKVVDGGYCVGCGSCAALDPSIRMGFDDYQRIQAVLPVNRKVSKAAAAACPFADGNPDEDTLARDLFGQTGIIEDSCVGRHLASYGGWVEEGSFRDLASSGGIGSWLQVELHDKGLIDAVLDVGEGDADIGGEPRFRFTIARTSDEIMANAKTRYYPVEMSGVIRFILDNPGRYAVIGVPCFVKALRLASRAEPLLSERVHYVLGIVCGHLKSAAFADAIAWQCGIRPHELTGIDFRTKLEGRPASKYGATVSGERDGQAITVTRPMEDLTGANWGQGLFKLKACEFCDDVLAETADAVVGDAWLPDYDSDYRGSNIVVVRNTEILDLLRAGADEGRLQLNTLSADQVAASQAGGLRHRRDGLSYRLLLTDRAKKWRPLKRVKAEQNHLDPHMRRIHRLRYELGQASHIAFKKSRLSGNMQDFFADILPLIDIYDRQMKPSLLQRIINRMLGRLVQFSRGVRQACDLKVKGKDI